MTDTTTNQAERSLESTNLLIMLYLWRKPILKISLAAAILSAIVSLLMNDRYKSTVIMYAEQQNSFGAQLLEYGAGDLLTLGEERDAERLLQIINSDQVRNKIVEKYQLWDVYEIDRDRKGVVALIAQEYCENVYAQITKFGSVEISVLDESPERARDMANDIALYTDSLANRLRSDRAMLAFKHIESSLNEALEEVRVMEDSMKIYKDLGVYSYVDQIAALTEMYGTAIAEGHPERAQLLKNDMNTLSRYATAYTNLERRLGSAYDKVNVLRRRYDLMTIDIESSIPAMRVVDAASAADKKKYPVRWLIVTLSTLSAFIFTFITLIIMDNFKKLRAQGKL
jgi:capsular polysaccharide biosynthesis protein